MSEQVRLGDLVVKNFDQLDADQQVWKDHWEEVIRFQVPSKDNVWGQRTPGNKANQRVFDGTAIKAGRKLANHLVSIMINPSSKWLSMTTRNFELDKDENVHAWLDMVSERILSFLDGSNFYDAAHEYFLDLVHLNTACMFIGKHPTKKISFITQPVFEWKIAENANHEVNVSYRSFKFTLRQLVEEFGLEAIQGDDRLEKDFQHDPNRKVELIHAIEPRDNFKTTKFEDVNIENQNTFLSITVMKDSKKVLRVKGFNKNPLAVTRWSRQSGEVYGRGPGTEARPEVKTLQVMKRVVLEAGQLSVAPPLQTTDNSLMKPVKFTPFGITYRRPGTDPIQPLVTGARPDIGLDLIQATQQDVKEFFFNDKLEIAEANRQTATEIIQRRDENFRELGAVSSRIDNEFITPMVDRVFDILWQDGEFGSAEDLPTKLQERLKENDGELGVKYSSLIDKALVSGEAENFTRAIQASGPVVQNDPNVMDNVDGDAVLRHNMVVMKAPASFLKPKREVQQIRERRDQAQQQRLEAEQAKTESETVKNIGDASNEQQQS